MEKYINGNLVKKILVHKKSENPYWEHCIGVHKFLWIRKSYDYWNYWMDEYTEEEMIKELPKSDSYFENGKVYYLPYIVLKFSKDYDELITFKTIEELDNWMTLFLNKYPNIFYKIED